MKKVFICAEIGINHNGDISIAKKLIDVASVSGCDAVKFQKRTIDKVYSRDYLDSPRESPWGKTQREQKEGLELGKKEYDEIDRYCKEKGILWYASAWDVDSQLFLRRYNLEYNKVASAMLVNEELLEEIAKEHRYTYIATGMSTLAEVDHAVEIFRRNNCPFELMHCNSTYPMPPSEANLKLIPFLSEKYGVPCGYSGHESDIVISVAAVAMGATSIERHITLDRNMYGSDQKASLEPYELFMLVKNIRMIEKAIGTGEKVLGKSELETKKKLRG